jgi:hypothetical protein
MSMKGTPMYTSESEGFRMAPSARRAPVVLADLDIRDAAKGPARIHRPTVAKRQPRLTADASDWAAVAARKEARA